MIKCTNEVNIKFLGVDMSDLVHFSTASEVIHIKHPLYRLRYTILTRCYNPKPSDYKYYKAKGIQVCDLWRYDPQSFDAWALNNGWSKGLSLDRIDPAKDYCPENCQFLSPQDNLIKMHKQGNKKGERSGNAKLTQKQVDEIRVKLDMGVMGTRIAKDYGVSKSTIHAINNGQNWKV